MHMIMVLSTVMSNLLIFCCAQTVTHIWAILDWQKPKWARMPSRMQAQWLVPPSTWHPNNLMAYTTIVATFILSALFFTRCLQDVFHLQVTRLSQSLSNIYKPVQHPPANSIVLFLRQLKM